MWISVFFSVTKLKYSPLYQWEHGHHKSRNHKEEDNNGQRADYWWLRQCFSAISILGALFISIAYWRKQLSGVALYVSLWWLWCQKKDSFKWSSIPQSRPQVVDIIIVIHCHNSPNQPLAEQGRSCPG